MTHQTNSTLQWEHVQPDKMRPHISGKTVIAGHTPQMSEEILDLGFLKLIDTNACRGGWLTAREAVSGKVIQTDESANVRERFLAAREIQHS
jgi:serine/threonine protein phosphatase 1